MTSVMSALEAHEAYVERVKAKSHGPRYDWLLELLSSSCNSELPVEDSCLYILDFDGNATNLWSTARPELSSRSRNANAHHESLMLWPGIGPSHSATVASQWATCLESKLSARQYLNIREVCIAGQSTQNSD